MPDWAIGLFVVFVLTPALLLVAGFFIERERLDNLKRIDDERRSEWENWLKWQVTADPGDPRGKPSCDPPSDWPGPWPDDFYRMARQQRRLEQWQGK